MYKVNKTRCDQLKLQNKDLRTSYNVRNLNKRFKRKDATVCNLTQENVVINERTIKLEKELETCRKKARKSAKKVWYLKSKLQSVISTKSHASSELIDQIRYYENLSEELK